MTNETKTPIQMISSNAAATLRLALTGRRDLIEKLYAPGSHEHMRQTHMLAHLERELGIEEQEAPWEVIQTHETMGLWLQLLRSGRNWKMTGGRGGEHTLTDSGAERAMAHWKGYRQQ